MEFATPNNLSDDTLDALDDLIAANIDGAKVLDEAGDQVRTLGDSVELASIAAVHRAHAQELQQLQRQNRRRPENDGTFGGKAHKAWTSFRTALNAGNPDVALLEARRAEERVCDAYAEAIKDAGSNPVNDVLHRQLRAVKKQRDHLEQERENR